MITQREIIIADSYGVYLPEMAAKYFNLSGGGICQEDIDILLSGPDSADYWEVWEDVLNTYEKTEGFTTYRLEQDGDLFLLHDFAADWANEYTLPAWTICALMYGDYSGLDESEVRELEEWLASESEGCEMFELIHVSEEASFSQWHDGPGLAADCHDCLIQVAKI